MIILSCVLSKSVTSDKGTINLPCPKSVLQSITKWSTKRSGMSHS